MLERTTLELCSVFCYELETFLIRLPTTYFCFQTRSTTLTLAFAIVLLNHPNQRSHTPKFVYKLEKSPPPPPVNSTTEPITLKNLLFSIFFSFQHPFYSFFFLLIYIVVVSNVYAHLLYTSTKAIERRSCRQLPCQLPHCNDGAQIRRNRRLNI